MILIYFFVLCYYIYFFCSGNVSLPFEMDVLVINSDYTCLWYLLPNFTLSPFIGSFRYVYNQTLFSMNSLACSSGPPKKALFGLLSNTVNYLSFFFPFLSLPCKYEYWVGWCSISFKMVIIGFISLYPASDKSKVQRNKMATAGEEIEYRCLIRATDGKKNISTLVTSLTLLYISL